MTRLSVTATFVSLLGASLPALADDATPPSPPTITLTGHIEVGLSGNPDSPANHVNFGEINTDRANQPQLNQIILTLERKLDPNATDWNFGFRIQPLIGSDARISHFLGELDTAFKGRTQVDILEAKLLAHAPLLSEGGVDFTLGQYGSPVGYEGVDALNNPFYSHSYNVEYGNPLKHTGGYAVAHVDTTLDIYLGGDTGVNTSLGAGDNNDSPAFLGGVALNNLSGGDLTIVLLSHIGPENPNVPGRPKLDKYLRDIGDAVITYKVNDTLTLISEIQYIHDAYGVVSATAGVNSPADAFGVAGYASYALTDDVTLNGRAEIFQDKKGFYVGAFPGNLDIVNSQRGRPNTAYFSPGTYSEFTIGVTYKPANTGLPRVTGVMIRPELRYDTDYDNHKQFNQQTSSNGTFTGKSSQVTMSVDLILSF